MASGKSNPTTRKRTGNSRKRSFSKLNKAFDKALEAMLNDYFGMLADYKAHNLHKLVSVRVEKKLLEYVLQSTSFNQMRAADILGISRSTLRKKIRAYEITIDKKKLPTNT